ncbi:MAG: hypothetical protein BWK73_04810 [Thiothrix lacustris]|uniref:Uncharacterized protein n=1 Tax=Thiothrix lacustris TaxID=525917 RepID=A0A1Y1QXM9_9GAMM|nr:MAG: hypothetical protein BWK73_04810 [Thiothrix lacustris]
MTPLLNHLQDLLFAAALPGLNRESVTLYIAEATPEYSIPFDPDGLIAAGSPLTLGMTPPATLVIRPFEGDLIDLVMVLNIILDDIAPATRGNDKRLKISAEPLSVNSAIIVITLQLREIIRYVPTQSGNLNINGILYEREPLQIPALPQNLNSIRHVES